MLTPAEKSLIAQIAAHESWARTENRTARTAKARQALEDKFLAEAGGDPRRAESLRKAYYARMALKSAQARRRRGPGDIPPTAAAVPASGGGTSTEDRIRAAHVVLDDAGVRISPSKVSKIVRDYERNVAANGFDFLAFLAKAAQLSAEQQRAALSNPDIARVISYTDRTGEDAVNNVLRGGGA